MVDRQHELMRLLSDSEITKTARRRAIGGHTQEASTALIFRCLTTLEVGHERLSAVSQTLRQDLRAGLLHPYPGDRTMTRDRLHQLDKLYQSVVAALDELVAAVGLKPAA